MYGRMRDGAQRELRLREGPKYEYLVFDSCTRLVRWHPLKRSRPCYCALTTSGPLACCDVDSALFKDFLSCLSLCLWSLSATAVRMV